MNFIVIEGKISRKVTRARGSINSQKAKQLAGASSLDVLAASKKKQMREKKAEESNVMKVRLPRTSPDYSSSSNSSFFETNAS